MNERIAGVAALIETVAWLVDEVAIDTAPDNDVLLDLAAGVNAAVAALVSVTEDDRIARRAERGSGL